MKHGHQTDQDNYFFDVQNLESKLSLWSLFVPNFSLEPVDIHEFTNQKFTPLRVFN